MNAPQILFLADSGPRVGGGHVMRCLTLAGALMARGARCVMLAPPAVAAIVARFGPPGVEVVAAEESVQASVAAAADPAPDWLVIDHYRLTVAEAQALRAPGRRLLVIDDLAARPWEADLLLDPSYGRRPEDYAGLIPARATALTGAAYALVRPQFVALRDHALARRGGPPRRLLVSLGLTDLDGVTGRTVQAILPWVGDIAIDVVVGEGAQSLPLLAELAQTDARIALQVAVRDMAALMAAADLAIGAGGSGVWERACLGLPAVTLVLADNQRDLARRLDDDGLTLAVEAFAPGFEAELTGALGRLMRDGALRQTIGAGTGALCDGQGAGRVAARIINAP